MKKLKIILALALAGFAAGGNAVAQDADTNSTAWLIQPLSLLQSLNIALQQNPRFSRRKNDLEAQYGVVVQTRAVALPQVTANGQYKDTEPQAIEGFPGAPSTPNQNWNAGVQITQSIYQGGKLLAAIRAAKVTKQQALAISGHADRHAAVRARWRITTSCLRRNKSP